VAIFNGGNALATVIQLAIASGLTVDGLLFDSTGERGTLWRVSLYCCLRHISLS
jgi:hypothetical protein